MYGILHVEIQHYLETRYSHDVWTAILKRAGLQNRIYLPRSNYVDAEITAIMEAASEIKGVPTETLFEDFGRFVVPALMHTYAPLIDPEWGMEDLLLNLERGVYRVMRAGNPGIQPPAMTFERVGTRQLRLHYNSPRRMLALVRGFILGVAAYYGETVDIHQQEQQKDDSSVAMQIHII